MELVLNRCSGLLQRCPSPLDPVRCKGWKQEVMLLVTVRFYILHPYCFLIHQWLRPLHIYQPPPLRNQPQQLLQITPSPPPPPHLIPTSTHIEPPHLQPDFHDHAFNNSRSIETGYVPKPKLEFTFFSREDVEGWLYRTEQILDCYNIVPEQWVRVAATHLQGSPLQWYYWLVRTNKGVPPWRGVWEENQEGHTLEYYQQEFMPLLHQIQDLSEDFLIGCFISGLQDTIKYDIVAKNPTTMEEAMWLARVEEEKMMNIIRGAKSTFQKGVSPTSQYWGTSNLKNHGQGTSTHPTLPML